METEFEIDEAEILEAKSEQAETPEVPRDWQPSQETMEAISGETASITPERQELDKSPESLPEKEPGGATRPSWDQPPQTPSDSPPTDASDQQNQKQIDQQAELERLKQENALKDQERLKEVRAELKRLQDEAKKNDLN